jgi:tetratricopeptide (TPR) repeat protein
MRALNTAATVADSEPHAPIRLHLQTLCALQQGWVYYRMGRLDRAERCVAAANLAATTGAHLRLRGQVLNLRSLIHRSRRRHGEALTDLAEAARLFMLDGDLFQLFSVYHNLACLIAAQAQSEADPLRRDEMFRRALTYSQRNDGYCRRYGIGHNSVLNKLLQVGLHRQLGDAATALRIATEAERLALDCQNIPDAITAHRHRVSILLRSGAESEARRLHRVAVMALHERQLARQFEKAYREEMDAWVRSGGLTDHDHVRSRDRTRR